MLQSDHSRCLVNPVSRCLLFQPFQENHLLCNPHPDPGPFTLAANFFEEFVSHVGLPSPLAGPLPANWRMTWSGWLVAQSELSLIACTSASPTVALPCPQLHVLSESHDSRASMGRVHLKLLSWAFTMTAPSPMLAHPRLVSLAVPSWPALYSPSHSGRSTSQAHAGPGTPSESSSNQVLFPFQGPTPISVTSPLKLSQTPFPAGLIAPSPVLRPQAHQAHLLKGQRPAPRNSCHRS